MPARQIFALLLACSTLVRPATAHAQSCPANVPHQTGQWNTSPYPMPINPISITLLHTGQILVVAGSENDASNNSPGSASYRSAVWDPTGTTESSIGVQEDEYDVFCSGTAVLPDGRALVVGGTSDYSFTGDRRASIYDPLTWAFLQSQNMADGRWYATATALADGRIMAFSGLKSTGGTNNTVEIYDLANAGAGWTAPATAPFVPPLFPHMALLPSGKVFFTGQGGGSQTANSWLFDPSARTWASSASTTTDRHYGSFALLPLLPPGYTPRVIELGGGNPGKASTEVIDLSAATPAWSPGPGMSTGRIEMNATILPNGKVLAEGGSSSNETPDTAGRTADVYTFSGSVGTMNQGGGGVAAFSRLYHSSALLLPDATVVSTGSNPSARGSYLPAIEIYTPAYLFDANDKLITTGRPAITGVTPTQPFGYGVPFSVTYTSASAIASAVLMRPGSSTHGEDMEQRLVGLCGSSPQPACSGPAGTLNLTTPPNGSVAPPGWYMLFLLDSAGVPSKAQWIQLTRFGTTPPRGSITSPANDVTVQAGSSVFFDTTSTATKYSWVFPGGSPPTSTAKTPGNVTFGSPGDYIVSLTLVDAAGNSDPSPPTRLVTATPASADFTLDVAPSSATVSPGQSATFAVTVNPFTGFSGAVTLSVGSESGFPTGITSGGFSPGTIVGSGTSMLTMNTTASALPYALSLTVTGTSGSLVRTASTSLIVALAPPATLAATPGNGQVALSWPASAGATGYQVKRGLLSGGPYVPVGCPTGTSFTDTGLTNGQTYRYVVSATFAGGPDSGGESANSGEASATPTAPLPTTTTSSTVTTSTSTSTSTTSSSTSTTTSSATSSSTTTSTTSTSSTSSTTTSSSTSTTSSNASTSSSTTTSTSTTSTSTSTSTSTTSTTTLTSTSTTTTSISTSTVTSTSSSTTSTSTSTATSTSSSTTSTSTSTATSTLSSTTSSTTSTATSTSSSTTSSSETSTTSSSSFTTSSTTSTSTSSSSTSSSTTTSSSTVTTTTAALPTTTSSTTTSVTSTSTSTTLPAGTCAAPAVLPPAGGTFAGTSSGASALGASCAPTANSPEVVYQWTPSASGTATFSTCSGTATTFDTVLYVRTASCTAGPDLACNDDTAGCGITLDGASPRRGSQVVRTVAAGQPYFIVVDGYSGQGGGFVLTVTPPAAGPATTTTTVAVTTTSTVVTVTTSTSTTTSSLTTTSVTTTTATTTTTSSTLPPSSCASPTVLPATGGTFVGTTTGNPAGLTGTCASTGTSPDAVFQWTPAASGVATVDTCSGTSTTFDTVLYMRSGTCGGGAEVGCNDDTAGCGTTLDGGSPRRGSQITPTVTAGQTYYIVVDGYAGGSGGFALTVIPPAGGPATTTTTAVTVTTSTSVTSSTVTTTTSTSSTTTSTLPPSSCASPTAIPPEGGSFGGTTTGAASTLGASCAPTANSPDAVFQWTPGTSGVATINTCSATATTFDTVLYLRAGSCGGTTDAACNDDTPGCGITLDGGSPRRGSQITPTVTAGQTYYIVVDGYSGQSGGFVLTVAPPP